MPDRGCISANGRVLDAKAVLVAKQPPFRTTVVFVDLTQNLPYRMG